MEDKQKNLSSIIVAEMIYDGSLQSYDDIVDLHEHDAIDLDIVNNAYDNIVENCAAGVSGFAGQSSTIQKDPDIQRYEDDRIYPNSKDLLKRIKRKLKNIKTYN